MGLDILTVLLVTFIGLLYSAKVYKHSDMSNVDKRVFSIVIPLQITRKLVPVLYVWRYSDSKGRSTRLLRV